MYITKTSIPIEWRMEIIRYLITMANEDGGWGLHIEGPSTVFGTSLNYVVLRIMGLPKDHPVCVKARATLHRLDGATGNPAWGKFWLATLGIYEWEGMNPVPPEFWLLPHFLPMHPGRWWVHCRAVFLPMGYIYGSRHTSTYPGDDFTDSLKEELYTKPYEEIDWTKQRNNIHPGDVYSPHTKLIDAINAVLYTYESCTIPPLRKAGLRRAYQLIKAQDENSAYQTIGPVSKTMHMLACYYEEGPDSPAFKTHIDKLQDFLWVGKEGMRMNGTNGVQLWDTSFISQALVESGLAKREEYHAIVNKVLEFIDSCQIKENHPNYEQNYRQSTKGAWPFSTRDQGYTVSDCAAEGLKAAIMLQDLPYTKKLIPYDRLCDCVDVLLSMQNPSGGYASYELIRAPMWVEWLNPAEVFGDIMREYEYPECTTSVVTALAIFRNKYPDYRSGDIESTIEKAVKYIHDAQREDGSWYGSWGICFTYAMMFALESLSLVGETYENSDRVRKACEFLVGHQSTKDGGWGESYRSCETKQWVDHPDGTQVVNTAFACLALMNARYPHREPIRRGIQLIMSRQQPNGEWLQEGIEGVFNKTCMISYPNYKHSFTIWACGRYTRLDKAGVWSSDMQRSTSADSQWSIVS